MVEPNVKTSRKFWSIKNWTGSGILAVVAIVVALHSNIDGRFQHTDSKSRSERDKFQEFVIKMAEEREFSNYHRKCEPSPVITKFKVEEDKLYVSFSDIRCRSPFEETIDITPKGIATPLAIFYFEAARNMEPSVKDAVTFSEYLMLADMACLYSGTDSAVEFTEKALQKAREKKNATGASFALRALAEMQFENYPNTELEKGRKFYSDAIKELSDLPKLKKNPTIEAQLWSDWALAESRVGELGKADIIYQKARNTIDESNLSDQQKHVWSLKLKTQIAEVAFKANKHRGEWIEIGKLRDYEEAPTVVRLLSKESKAQELTEYPPLQKATPAPAPIQLPEIKVKNTSFDFFEQD